MNLHVFPDHKTLSEQAAAYIAQLVRRKPDAVLCLASGDTPVATYQRLNQLVQAGELDLSRCLFIGLDEWVGFGPDDVGSCAYYLYRDLFTPARIRPEQIAYFDAKADDLPAECERIDRVIADAGGLDLLLVGIGVNGHIALNEPGTSFTLRCHLSDLAESTIAVGQKYFTRETPLSRGITLGLQQLQEAREVLLMANGERKAAILHEALNGPVTEQVPASILQTHSNARVWLDEQAASLLTDGD